MVVSVQGNLVSTKEEVSGVDSRESPVREYSGELCVGKWLGFGIWKLNSVQADG